MGETSVNIKGLLTAGSSVLVKQKPGRIRHRFAKHRLIQFASLSIGCLLILTIGSLVWLKHHSLIRANLAGIPIGSMESDTSLQSALQQKAAQYRLSVRGPTNTTSYSLADSGISIDINASVAKAISIKKPPSLLARIAFWKTVNVPLTLKVDNTKLASFITNNLNQQIAAPQDAVIVMSDSGQATITDAQAGQSYTISNPKQSLLDSVSSLNTQTFNLGKQSLPPAIKTGDVITQQKKVAAMLARQVTFTINGHAIALAPSDIKQWIELTPVPANKTIDVTVNSGKVLAYINKIARPYIQPPVTQVSMTDSSGVEQILIPGINGVDIINKDQVATSVTKQLTDNGGPITIDLPVQFASFTTITAQPHDKWIVVDTTSKRLYAYEQTNLVNSFLVSAGAPRTPTVTGQFSIYAKYAIQDMRGNNVDGSQYFQPNVQWINYFYGGYAIHGNYWRPLSYFGNVNSSHGCVGLVNSDAQWVYDWAPIGTTVIVHS